MRWRYALSFDHQVWLSNDCLFAIYDSMGPLRLQRLMKCFLSICSAMLRNEEECITVLVLMKIMFFLERKIMFDMQQFSGILFPHSSCSVFFFKFDLTAIYPALHIVMHCPAHQFSL